MGLSGDFVPTGDPPKGSNIRLVYADEPREGLVEQVSPPGRIGWNARRFFGFVEGSFNRRFDGALDAAEIVIVCLVEPIVAAIVAIKPL